jgi:ABC-type multidrug transport system ATPase subunit
MNEEFAILGNLKHVTKTFGEVVAVSDTSFSIEKGSIVGFLGPNGSGKTTSIEMLLGLIKPDGGEVRLFGRNPFTDNRINNLIGYVPEEGIFPKYFTAYNYLYTMGRFNLDKETAKTRALEVLSEIGLYDVKDKRIRQFSKGMKQRIKIGQALLHKPALVIADEPFNGLDPVVRRNMFNLIQHYRKEYKTTFVISSHILFEVEKLANTIILLYKGRTIAQGAPHRIRELIQDQPHSIEITAPDTKELSRLMIDKMNGEETVIRSINFSRGSRSDQNQIIVETQNPRVFYKLFNEIVIEKNLVINEFRPIDEGLESLFKSLTVG